MHTFIHNKKGEPKKHIKELCAAKIIDTKLFSRNYFDQLTADMEEKRELLWTHESKTKTIHFTLS